jgi:hypothetical protein
MLSEGGIMAKSIVVCVAFFCVLLGCSPRPPLAQDTGKGTIVGMCGKETAGPGSGSEVPVGCNNRVVASLPAGTYCEMELLDGQYSLSAGSGDPAQSTVPLKVDVALSAGSVKYFVVAPQDINTPGLMILKEIPAASATGAISKLKKVASH